MTFVFLSFLISASSAAEIDLEAQADHQQIVEGESVKAKGQILGKGGLSVPAEPKAGGATPSGNAAKSNFDIKKLLMKFKGLLRKIFASFKSAQGNGISVGPDYKRPNKKELRRFAEQLEAQLTPEQRLALEKAAAKDKSRKERKSEIRDVLNQVVEKQRAPAADKNGFVQLESPQVPPSENAGIPNQGAGSVINR